MAEALSLDLGHLPYALRLDIGHSPYAELAKTADTPYRTCAGNPAGRPTKRKG